MNQNRLNELIIKFSCCRIAVIGDFFLDKYLEVDTKLAEVSLETGKTANQVVDIRHSPGAAGNVVANLVSLGANGVMVIGFTGDDGDGYDMRKDFMRLGCNMDFLLSAPERHTPTYLKPRDIEVSGLGGEFERYDTKNRLPLPVHVEKSLIEALPGIAAHCDAVIVVDQAEEENCGAVTEAVRAALSSLAGRSASKVFWADSRARPSLFKNMIVKANQQETVQAAFPEHRGRMDEDLIKRAGQILSSKTGREVFMTRGEKGILVLDLLDFINVHGVRVEGPVDPTGAGDSVTAGAVLALASGASPEEAALIGNLAASVTVQKLGVTGSASRDDLIRQLSVWEEQKEKD